MIYRTRSVATRTASRVFATLTATTVLALFAASDVLAQATPPATPAQPRPAPRQPAPRQPAQPAPQQPAQQQQAPAQAQQQAQQEAPQLIFSPWVKLCNKDADPKAKRVCVTVKDGRVESGLLVVSVAIIEMDGETKKLLRMNADALLFSIAACVLVLIRLR